MAKRRISRTDPRSSGGSAGRSKSSRSSSKSAPKRSARGARDEGERPRKSFDKPFGERRSSSRGEGGERPRKFSDKPFGERRSSSRSEGSERPRKSFDKSFGERRSSSRSTEGGSERPRKFSDKPFDKRKSSSRFGKSEGDERPKRSFSRGDSERSSDRKRPFNREGGDAKPRRGFPDDVKRDDERPRRTFREKEEGSARRDDERGERKSFRPRNDGDKPFTKRPFNRDDRGERGERPFGKRPFERGEERPHNRYNQADRGEELHRPRHDEEERDEPRREEKRPRKSFTESRTISSKGYKDRKADIEEAPKQIRLNRYLANSGVSSRREADEIIKMGLVTVNGKTITEMGFQVQPGDVVKHEGKMLRAEKPVYILMNKPKGFLTTTADPEERQTVMQLVASHIKERIYPVGRLDRNTTGLLLLTNDGALAEQLSHPSYNVKKIYKVELDRPLAKGDFEKIAQGIQLEEGRAMVDDIAIVSEDGKTVGVEIHIGWNRVVRRIFEALEYQVVKLDRTIYAGLDKKDLPRGNWRHLREEEIIRLKHLKKGTR